MAVHWWCLSGNGAVCACVPTPMTCSMHHAITCGRGGGWWLVVVVAVVGGGVGGGGSAPTYACVFGAVMDRLQGVPQSSRSSPGLWAAVARRPRRLSSAPWMSSRQQETRKLQLEGVRILGTGEQAAQRQNEARLHTVRLLRFLWCRRLGLLLLRRVLHSRHHAWH